MIEALEEEQEVSSDICPRCGNFKSNCSCEDELDLPMPQGTHGPDDKEMIWDYTVVTQRRGIQDGDYDPPDEKSPYGYYKDRPIIGRDSPVIGGVYTTGRKEALVVDEKYGLLEECYEEVLQQLKHLETNGNNPKKVILGLVFKYVREKLKYDNDAVEESVKKLNAGKTDNSAVKVSLDYFINKGVGVCRHQAVLAGYLLEKFKQDGYISGKASVDRNYSDKEGGHAWVRYTNSGGKVIVMDPAQNYLGYIDKVANDRLRGIYRWSYERP